MCCPMPGFTCHPSAIGITPSGRTILAAFGSKLMVYESSGDVWTMLTGHTVGSARNRALHTRSRFPDGLRAVPRDTACSQQLHLADCADCALLLK
eukprot:scaffold141638_cov17-Tisochrysis_lutea.AAC.1